MKLPLILITLAFSHFVYGQSPNTYSAKGKTHLIGAFELTVLETDTTYSKWYQENYENAQLDLSKTDWKENLGNTNVEIYMGTWCGDSKNWVPKFVRMWEELGLKRSQLKFIALYGSGDHYKQGPEGEEKGKQIHRVPTFIFKKDDTEYARIVESPSSDLITDVAQIALGYPSKPNYKAANFLLKHFAENTIDQMLEQKRYYLYSAYHLVGKSSELNTLGYVLLKAGETEKAIFTFELNTHLFRYEPNVYDSYGEALAEAGNVEEARKQYQKVLELDPENDNAKQQLMALKD
ncbi:hypothetical protein GCM10009122_27000 [Fulvivirga kasyanovii]|uniref:Tetratricopeptide repeat protein n=1 Tax=Fulvivirga kasyanovii TaxID=396812 RepID=A0ABW9RLD6_9BACT|nr:tetratricopeptide repeat protein [Fulvivirga kasyanovii]MTI24823.1 tetratricopeptide repeat protein [Fulvivirga kasyanovii]